MHPTISSNDNLPPIKFLYTLFSRLCQSFPFLLFIAMIEQTERYMYRYIISSSPSLFTVYNNYIYSHIIYRLSFIPECRHFYVVLSAKHIVRVRGQLTIVSSLLGEYLPQLSELPLLELRLFKAPRPSVQFSIIDLCPAESEEDLKS